MEKLEIVFLIILLAVILLALILFARADTYNILCLKKISKKIIANKKLNKLENEFLKEMNNENKIYNEVVDLIADKEKEANDGKEKTNASEKTSA